MIRFTFLGTSTSQGVPVVGCTCGVCTSSDPKDNRLRSSLLITEGDKNVLIDCGPDLRQQLLRANVNDIEGILMTHEHNDHIIGLDDIRPINFKYKKDIPVFCLDRVAIDLKTRFDYIFSSSNYPGIPQVDLNIIDKDAVFDVSGIQIKALEVMHGQLPILGYIIGDFAYLTDVKTLKDAELKKLTNVTHIVISALHHKEHHSHQNLEEALQMAQKFPDARIYLTHFSHFMGKYQDVSKELPSNVFMAYDGLTIEVD